MNEKKPIPVKKGDIFGKLKVVGDYANGLHGHARVLVRCECGTPAFAVYVFSLISHATIKCDSCRAELEIWDMDRAWAEARGEKK